MLPACFFLRLPPSAALLVLAALLRLTTSHVLPRETAAARVRALAAVPWPIAPAPAPTRPAGLRQRGLYNTICGYIGGDAALPATCAAGSHCALDVEYGAIGCCPDGPECTAGIFTACVDRNSGPQTVNDPYVYTCAAANVCYRNTFDGGYFQYGCGSASHVAAVVATTVPGREAVGFSRITGALTATPTPLSRPTTIGSDFPTSSVTALKPGQRSTRASLSPSATGGTSAPDKGDDSPNTGAVVGGAVGGVASLAALVTLSVFLWRRRKGNTRRGPGPNQNTQYISPMADARHAFEPLPSSQDNSDIGLELPQHLPPAHTSAGSLSPGRSDDDVGAPPARHADHIYEASPLEGIVGLGSGVEPDRIPLTRETDDCSPDFGSALRVVDSAVQLEGHDVEAFPRPRRSGGGALWQQNRRPSRNPMWI